MTQASLVKVYNTQGKKPWECYTISMLRSVKVRKAAKKPRHHHLTPRIVIVGGGFAGITAARTLADLGKGNVTLISNKSYFEYYPGFYKVVTGAEASRVCIPLADMLPKSVDIIIDTITGIDLKNTSVVGDKGHVYGADYLVLAMGSQTTYFNLPGLPDLSFGFKSIGEATKLKEHVKNLFVEKTKASDMVSNFQVVIVGGGPSGVEVAGDLTLYMEQLAYSYKIDPSFITIDIIDRGNRLIGAAHPKASEAALRRLRKLGVNVFLNREVVAEDVEKILIGDMSLHTKTVIWTAGTSINALFSKTEGLEYTERRRVLVNDFLEVPTAPNVYVIGDGAGTQYSGLAQTALSDGRFVAKDIVRRIKHKSRKKYVAKKVDYIIPIGRSWALMSFGGGKWHVFGYFAYLARRMVDIFFFIKILPFQKVYKLFK